MEITQTYIKNYLAELQKRHSDFPSEMHELAWETAEYFDEPYGLWVRRFRHHKVANHSIRRELSNLKSRNLSRKSKVRILMAWLKK